MHYYTPCSVAILAQGSRKVYFRAQACLHRVLAKGAMNDSRADGIKRQFELIDDNKDGTIQRSELADTLKFLDPSLWTDANVDALLASMDTNKDGRIQYAEFLEYVFANTEGDENALFFMRSEEAALRELREETGYGGKILGNTGVQYLSPGLTDECVRTVAVEVRKCTCNLSQIALWSNGKSI